MQFRSKHDWSSLLISKTKGRRLVANRDSAPGHCLDRQVRVRREICRSRSRNRCPARGAPFCEVCWQPMAEVKSAAQGSYTLLERPGLND